MSNPYGNGPRQPPFGPGGQPPGYGPPQGPQANYPGPGQAPQHQQPMYAPNAGPQSPYAGAYGPPAAPMMQVGPQPMGQPLVPMMHPGGVPFQATTVCGVPLQPGERVIFFHKSNKIGSVVFAFIFGAVFLTFFIGIFAIIGGFMLLFSSPWTFVLTNQRLITIKRGRTLKQAATYQEIQHMTNTIRRYSSPSGPRTEPGYWVSTKNIALRTARSGTINISSSDVNMMAFMPMLVRCKELPGFADSAPSVPYEP